MEERPFCFNVFWGDEKKRPHVEFSRRGSHYCIYCGAKSDSREHCPSKVFLSKPYPDNLPVLPACIKCNNGFSEDESFVAQYIDSLMLISGERLVPDNNVENSGLSCNAFTQAKKDWEEYLSSGEFPKNSRIMRILTKLTIGHMVYELSEGYENDGNDLELESIEYKFSFQMSKVERAFYDNFVSMSDKVLPELGSRVFDRIYVIEAVPQHTGSSIQIRTPIVVMDWNDVQIGKYSYIAWIERDGKFHVKIKINNFLFSHLLFSQMSSFEN